MLWCVQLSRAEALSAASSRLALEGKTGEALTKREEMEVGKEGKEQASDSAFAALACSVYLASRPSGNQS